MKPTCFTFAFLLVMTSVAVAQGLENPDFEQPGIEGQTPSGWTVMRGKFYLDSGRKNTGTFAGKLDGGENASIVQQDVSVTPGTTYQFSGFWRNGDRTADFDTVMVEVRWLADRAGRDMGQAGIMDSGNVISEWTPFQLPSMTAPPGVGAARIILRSRFGIGAFDSLFWGIPGGAPPALVTPPASSVPSSSPIVPLPVAEIPALSEVLSTSQVSPPPTAPGAVVAPAPVQPIPSLIPSLAWVDDLRAARRMAAAEQKRILVFFSAENEESRNLESRVFAHPAVVALLRNYIPVKLDFEKNKNLALALQVAKPGIVTVYDAKGEFVTRLNAPLTPESVATNLKALGN